MEQRVFENFELKMRTQGQVAQAVAYTALSNSGIIKKSAKDFFSGSRPKFASTREPDMLSELLVDLKATDEEKARVWEAYRQMEEEHRSQDSRGI